MKSITGRLIACQTPHEYTISLLLTGLVTGAAILIEPVAGHAASSSLYLLLVVIAGLRFKRGAVLFVAATSTFAWYTVFIPPHFAFHIGKIEDAIVFASFFAVAMAMGHLTSRLRSKEIGERMREQRTAAL
jgi:two-component system sensor histidine kinase KdpD